MAGRSTAPIHRRRRSPAARCWSRARATTPWRPTPRATGSRTRTAALALSPDGERLAVATAAVEGPRLPDGPVTVPASAVPTASVVDCVEPRRQGEAERQWQDVAVAYAPDGALVVQYRDPARLTIQRGDEVREVELEGAASVRDTGHDLFHGSTGSLTTCASCHPEGGEDGHLWRFSEAGPRRTPTLRGGLLGTEPFHWAGDQPDLGAIMSSTFTDRMRGHDVGADEIEALGQWLDAQPALPGIARDAKAIERGRALFDSDNVGCAGCHAGPERTDSRTLDVGTGGAFQVPSLRGVAHRAPYMHDGCAESLRATVDGSCAPVDAHGEVSGLTDGELDDLVAFVASL